jgi:glutamine amidotransferase/cyclase
VGLDILESFLSPDESNDLADPRTETKVSGLAKRVIACLDVRANDSGDLVVTKGDQYDVRETGESLDW